MATLEACVGQQNKLVSEPPLAATDGYEQLVEADQRFRAALGQAIAAGGESHRGGRGHSAIEAAAHETAPVGSPISWRWNARSEAILRSIEYPLLPRLLVLVGSISKARGVPVENSSQPMSSCWRGRCRTATACCGHCRCRPAPGRGMVPVRRALTLGPCCGYQAGAKAPSETNHLSAPYRTLLIGICVRDIPRAGSHGFSSERKFSNPQTSFRNEHVEALGIFPNRALCGSPYTTRNNMEHPHANFG